MLAQITDHDEVLGHIAHEEGFSVSDLPRARKYYLIGLLRMGTHEGASKAVGWDNAEYIRNCQDQRFRRLVGAVRGVLDDIRRHVIDDLLHARSCESDKVLMFVAERRDERYLPPQARLALKMGNQQGSPINIAIVLPSGVSVTPRVDGEGQNPHQTDTKGGVTAENPYKTRGFLQRVEGCKPSTPENGRKIGEIGGVGGKGDGDG